METVRPVLEIQMGGGVDADHLDFIRGLHDYTNKQQDLFKEIPTLDPELPSSMKIIGKIGEFRVVRHVGTGTSDDCVDYLLFDKNLPVAWIAVCEIDREHRIPSWVFRENAQGAQVKSIYLDERYRGKNLGVKLYHFLLSKVVDYLVADTLQTQAGVRLWKKLQNSSLFKVEVYDQDRAITRKRWAGKDFNQVYNTDGILVPWVTLASKYDALLSDD